MSSPKVTEGTVTFKHPSLPSDKPCETWYKVIGDLKGSQRPLVTLHGGPGACHNYLLPSLSELPAKYGIPVVFYDQIGNGKSTHYREKRLDTEFWTPELIMADLENLLEHLGIADDYDLLGQSWGGMMGAMWAIKGHKGLKSLIISDSPASMTLWVDACNSLRAKLPREVDEVLEKHEKAQTYDSQEYKDAVMFFYKRHLCRMEEWPQDVLDSLDWLEKDDTVYMTMNGPSEFTVIGSLKTWSVVDDCKKITVPTLLINGEHDEAQDICVAPFFRGIPKCKWITVQGAAHMPNAEFPEKYAEVVTDFLKYL